MQVFLDAFRDGGIHGSIRHMLHCCGLSQGGTPFLPLEFMVCLGKPWTRGAVGPEQCSFCCRSEQGRLTVGFS